jgi:hypothetical protein
MTMDHSAYTGGICPLINMKKIMAGRDAICIGSPES